MRTWAQDLKNGGREKKITGEKFSDQDASHMDTSRRNTYLGRGSGYIDRLEHSFLSS